MPTVRIIILCMFITAISAHQVHIQTWHLKYIVPGLALNISKICESDMTHTRNLCSSFNPSKVHTHTHTHTHTHREHTPTTGPCQSWPPNNPHPLDRLYDSLSSPPVAGVWWAHTLDWLYLSLLSTCSWCVVSAYTWLALSLSPLHL